MLKDIEEVSKEIDAGSKSAGPEFIQRKGAEFVRMLHKALAINNGLIKKYAGNEKLKRKTNQ